MDALGAVLVHAALSVGQQYSCVLGTSERCEDAVISNVGLGGKKKRTCQDSAVAKRLQELHPRNRPNIERLVGRDGHDRIRTQRQAGPKGLAPSKVLS